MECKYLTINWNLSGGYLEQRYLLDVDDAVLMYVLSI